MASPRIVADFETQLSTAIAVGGVAFSIADANDDDGVALPTGTYYFTIDNGQSNKEYLAGTLTGNDVTAVVSVSRQATETSGAARAHRVGASVIITDFATYKKYIDTVAIQGAPSADVSTLGITKISVTAANPAIPIAVGDNDPRILQNTYSASVVGTDAYAINPSSAVGAYAAGQSYVFKADVANTGPATLNVSGLGAKTIKKNTSEDLVTGDIALGEMVVVLYDGTNFQMLSGVKPVIDYQAFTTNGTWSKPAGLTGNEMVIVEMVGAGGGGGSGVTTNVGTGGGGGAWIRKQYLASDLTSTVAVSVPAGGAAGTGGSSGTGGGNTTFGSILTAYGGGGGGSGSGRTGGSGGGVGGAGSGDSASATLGGYPATVVGVLGIAGQGAGGTSDADGANAEYGGASGGGGATTAHKGGSSLYGGAGGGAGGATGSSGGQGGSHGTMTVGGGAAGGTNTNAGAAGTTTGDMIGQGGGGGGANGAGGVGGVGSGGGGGGRTTASTSNGGAGGRGECRVWIMKN